MSQLIWIHLFGLASVFGQTISAEHGMVATANPLATKAGIEILQKGGNAADAAVGIAFALGVVEPNASGVGGGGFMLYANAETGKVRMIDFRETTPRNFNQQQLFDPDGEQLLTENSSVMAIGVPGTVAGLLKLHAEDGSLDLKDILAPAIKYARDGFEVSEKFSDMIMSNFDKMAENPELAAHYVIDGLPAMPGEQVYNKEMAECYEEIASKGARGFYRGNIAASVVKTVKDRGGVLSKKDLKKYKALDKVPVSGTYRGYDIFSAAAPAGGTQIIQLLNILEQYEIQSYTHDDPKYLHILAEAMKMVFIDKSASMGDPDFTEVPVSDLISKTHAEALGKLIIPGQASFDYHYDLPLEPESGSTTHFSVVDAQGNMLALTQSVNHWFGSGISDPTYGVLLNDHLKDFSRSPDSPNSLQSLKRPASSIAPTIVSKDGKPFLTVGTPGATRIISALVQIIVNIVDFNMEIDDAIEAPRIHAIGDELYLENRFLEASMDSLRAWGHSLTIKAPYDLYFGGAQGILIDPNDSLIKGGADSRRDGDVVGY